MDSSTSAMELPSPTITTRPASDEQSMGQRLPRGTWATETPLGSSRKDRRRMQNRIAQRAYRQRKESAIDLLSDKVLQLEKSREKMSQEFINFTTAILSQEAAKNSPEVLEYIRQSSSNLLRAAAGLNDNEAPSPQDSDPRPALTVGEPEGGHLPLTTPAVGQVNQPDPSTTATYTAEYDDATLAGLDEVPMGYPDWLPPSQSNDPFFDVPVNQMEDLPHINVQLPGASYASTLPCPRSYAAQERTFARRLHRATQESGFLLASMKNPPPLLYNKVFRFCLHFETKEDIRLRMLDVLKRPENQTLHNGRYPFMNAGGSGMPGSSDRIFGPTPEPIQDLRSNPDLPILDPGYVGDFFDPDEIEICLRSYGVTIPPRREFVTAYLDLTMFEDVENRGPAAHQQYSDLSMNSLHPEINPGVDWGRVSTAVEAAPALHNQNIMVMGLEVTPEISESLPRREYWQTPLISRRKVTVDVERLITCLTNSTVCLGGTPTVRVPDIRKALKESLVYEL